MSLSLLLVILLIVLLAGGFRDWGSGPFYGTGRVGGISLGTVLVIVLILALIGAI